MAPLDNRASVSFAGAALALLAANSAIGALIIDLRAVSATGGFTVVDSKYVDPSNAVPGATITMRVYAVVTGHDGNPANDGILSVAGSFLSTNGGTRGNLVATRASTFTATGSSDGTVRDLDGDGDLDVGSNTPSAAAGFFSARASTAPAPVFGPETLLGTLVYTYTDGFNGAGINFRPRAAGTAGSWFEDGTQITSSSFMAGTPVIFFYDPEPSGALLASVPVAFGLLTRTRGKHESCVPCPQGRH